MSAIRLSALSLSPLFVVILPLGCSKSAGPAGVNPEVAADSSDPNASTDDSSETTQAASAAADDQGSDDGDDGAPEDSAIPSDGIFAASGITYSEEPLADRDQAVNVAGTLALAPSLSLLGGDSGSSGLWLTDDTAFDRLETYVSVRDPSISAVKPAEIGLCVLTAIDYLSLPTTDQTVSVDINMCFPKSNNSSGEKAAQSRNNEGGGEEGGAGGSEATTTLSEVTFKSYVNTDLQLVVDYQYVVKATQSWMQDLYVAATIIAISPRTDELPNGEFVLLLSGKTGSTEGDEVFQAKLAIGAVPGGDSGGRFAMTYNENDLQMGSYRRLAGYFDVVDGILTAGNLLGDIEGWDPTTGEPGGMFRVAYDKVNMVRERSIPDWAMAKYDKGAAADVASGVDAAPSAVDGAADTLALADFDPETTTSQCFALGQYSNRVYGYRAFDDEGNDLEYNYGFEFTNADNTVHGWASYWGVNAYPWFTPSSDYGADGGKGLALDDAATSGSDSAASESESEPVFYDPNVPLINDGDTVYKFDWSTYDYATGTGGVDLATPYTVHVRSGKFYKHSHLPVDMSKLDGKRFDWVWDYVQSRSVRIEWRHEDQAFYTVAVWESAGTDDWSFNWQPVDAVPFALEGTLWAWSDVLGGSVVFSKSCDEGGENCIVGGTMQKDEVVTDAAEIPTELRCYDSCARGGGIDFAVWQDRWQNWETAQSTLFYPNRAITSDPDSFEPTASGETVYQFDAAEFQLVAGTDGAVSLTNASSQSWDNLSIDGLIPTSEANRILAANPLAGSWEIRDQAQVYYSYEWSASIWNQTVWLTVGGAPLTFDAPRRFEYTLRSEDLREGEPTAGVGQSFMLNLDYGYLSVPWESKGFVTDPLTGFQWENWAPAFALADGVVLTDAADGAQFKVKAEYVDRWLTEIDAERCSQLSFAGDLVLAPKVNPITGEALPEPGDADFENGGIATPVPGFSEDATAGAPSDGLKDTQ